MVCLFVYLFVQAFTFIAFVIYIYRILFTRERERGERRRDHKERGLKAVAVAVAVVQCNRLVDSPFACVLRSAFCVYPCGLWEWKLPPMSMT